MRMLTLDRYIARQYLLNIVILLFILGSFVVVVDVSLNLQRFAENAERNAAAAGHKLEGMQRTLAALVLVVDLWWPRLLQLFNYTAGLVLVAAMGFTFTQLVRHRELTAILASGVSLQRAARPVLLVAALVLGAVVVNQELVLPRIAPLIARDNTQAGARGLAAFAINLAPDSQGRLFSALRFDPQSATMTEPSIWLRDQQGRATARIAASSARWVDGAWQLERGISTPLAVPTSGAPPLSTPVAMVQSDLDPTTLISFQYRAFAHNMSWAQILATLNSTNPKPEVVDNLTRIGLGRLANLAATFLTLVVCIPFFLTREPGNAVVQSLKCAPLAIGALLGSSLAALAPIPGLPIALAVSLPALTLVPLAIAAFTGIRT